MSQIWMPGHGMVSLEGTAVDRAVREYDERLFYARNASTGLHTIFIKMPHGEDPVAILAFPDGEPSPDYALQRLYETDARRHGLQILEQMRRENEAEKQRFRDSAAEAAGVLAEAVDSYMHNNGQTPYRKVVLGHDPVKKTAVKRG